MVLTECAVDLAEFPPNVWLLKGLWVNQVGNVKIGSSRAVCHSPLIGVFFGQIVHPISAMGTLRISSRTLTHTFQFKAFMNASTGILS